MSVDSSKAGAGSRTRTAQESGRVSGRASPFTVTLLLADSSRRAGYRLLGQSHPDPSLVVDVGTADAVDVGRETDFDAGFRATDPEVAVRELDAARRAAFGAPVVEGGAGDAERGDATGVGDRAAGLDREQDRLGASSDASLHMVIIHRNKQHSRRTLAALGPGSQVEIIMLTSCLTCADIPGYVSIMESRYGGSNF